MAQVLAPNRKVYAVKRVRVSSGRPQDYKSFLDEIALLERLRGRPNIIHLFDSEVSRAEGLIFYVLEFGETDLAHLLSRRDKQRAAESKQSDDNFLRLWFEQMVEAVRTIHAEHIVHSDLKPANFLVVEGSLKLIDFGIAKSFAKQSQSEATDIVREQQVGTLNYMSPEAILNGAPSALSATPIRVGRASDIWSLGCILYQMVYGRTPFSHITGAQRVGGGGGFLLHRPAPPPQAACDGAPARAPLANTCRVSSRRPAPQPSFPSSTRSRTRTTRSPSRRSPHQTRRSLTCAAPPRIIHPSIKDDDKESMHRPQRLKPDPPVCACPPRS